MVRKVVTWRVKLKILRFWVSCILLEASSPFRINLPLFSTVVPACVFMFLSCRPFVAIQHYQQVLWVLKSLLSPIGAKTWYFLVLKTIFSLAHIEGITLGAGEEVDEVAEGASAMGVDGIGEVSDRASEGQVAGVYGTGFTPILRPSCVNL